MVKVIEHGKLYKKKKCMDCGCVFEFHKCYGEKEPICPECGTGVGRQLEHLVLVLKRSSQKKAENKQSQMFEENSPLLDVDTLGWKADINGKRYGDYIAIETKTEKDLMGCINHLLEEFVKFLNEDRTIDVE